MGAAVGVAKVSLADGAGTLSDLGWWHARDERLAILDKLAGERLVGLQGPQRDDPGAAAQRALESLLLALSATPLNEILVRPTARTG